MVRYGPEAIGKLARVWLESAILVPAVDVLPTVVQYDIVIAQVPQPQIDHPLRRGQEQVIGYIATKCIPVVLVRSASAFRKECGSRRKSKKRRTHPIGGVRASPFLIASEPTTSAAATDKRARNGHMLLLSLTTYLSLTQRQAGVLNSTEYTEVDTAGFLLLSWARI